MLMAARTCLVRRTLTASGPHTNFLFRSAVQSSGLNTTYSFSSQAIGTAASNRWVIVAATGMGSQAPDTITVGGVTADIVIDTGAMVIAVANVPTGTTATIVTEYPINQNQSHIAYWTVNMSSGVPTATVSQAAVAGFIQTSSITVPSFGFLIAATGAADGSDKAHTFGGGISITEDADVFLGVNSAFGSVADLDGSGESGNVSSTFSGGTGQHHLAVATWQ